MKEYKTVSKIAGPLVFVEQVEGVGYGEIVEITLPSGEKKTILPSSSPAATVPLDETASASGSAGKTMRPRSITTSLLGGKIFKTLVSPPKIFFKK